MSTLSWPKWPKQEVTPRPEADDLDHVRSYLRMRIAIGVLGIAVPLLLVFGEPLLFNGQPFLRGSLSAYYYSGMREVFVGSLCAVGVFLIFYKLARVTQESVYSTIAGAAVIVVALFPTGRPGAGIPATPLQDRLGADTVEWIHFIASVVFIVFLARLGWLFAKHVRGADWWRSPGFHQACTAVIVGALLLAGLEAVTGWPDRGLLVAEFAAVMAFGASWLGYGLDRRVVFVPEGKPARERGPEAPPAPDPR